eukprot:SAG11_NODE_6300_length_1342_cov_1.309735_3_plen_189_part_00
MQSPPTPTASYGVDSVLPSQLDLRATGKTVDGLLSSRQRARAVHFSSQVSHFHYLPTGEAQLTTSDLSAVAATSAYLDSSLVDDDSDSDDSLPALLSESDSESNDFDADVVSSASLSDLSLQLDAFCSGDSPSSASGDSFTMVPPRGVLCRATQPLGSSVAQASPAPPGCSAMPPPPPRRGRRRVVPG